MKNTYKYLIDKMVQSNLDPIPNILDAARFYVHEMGWSVIPLKDKDKIPAIPSWKELQKRLPTDQELVNWFGSGKPRNIGIVTGAISNLDVLDLDSPQAVSYAEQHFFKSHLIVQTAKGQHWYYSHKTGSKNFQGRADMPNIDLRAEGGYVVAPPSLHPTGARYTWLTENFSAGTILSPLPELPSPPSSTAKLSIEEIEQGVSKGKRNSTMARYVGLLIHQGLNRDQCLDRCMETNKRNTPPLEEKDVAKTLASIFALHEKEAAEKMPPEQSTGQGEEERVSLISLLTTDSFTYFHDQLKEPYVRFCTKDGHEIHPVNSKRFQSFIQNVG